jgi:transposase
MMMIATRGEFNHVVAFEVSKATLVVRVRPDEEEWSIAHRPQAVRRLLRAQMKRNAKAAAGPLLVVCEATGGYEGQVLAAAVEFGLACHRAHGSRVRAFAGWRGQLAKTDALDARLIADYALSCETLRLYRPPSAEERALKELKGRRDDVQTMLIAETNRLEHAAHASVVKSLKAHIRGLQTALAALETEIAELVRTCAPFARKARLMRSVIGVGPVTATTLLADLPELGSLTKGEAARLAGLAPINRDSGQTSGRRRVAPGRRAIRRTLYMAAVSAMQHNPILRAFANQLTRRGKTFNVVVTAVMRKLIVILNAILRTGEPWRGAQTA